MSEKLATLQQQLCNMLQDGLPLDPRPWQVLADLLKIQEPAVLLMTRELLDRGFIRRIAPVIDYRRLGRIATLVAAHVDPDRLGEVTAVINSLPGVSHNYLREHHYNLWFTLQGESLAELEGTLAALRDALAVDFHSLPAEQFFKLDVRFNASNSSYDAPVSPIRPGSEPARLGEKEKTVLRRLQQGIPLVSEPFSGIDRLSTEEVIAAIGNLRASGVIKRIAAIVDHRKLGYTANVMFCCRADEPDIDRSGRILASFPAVSHCYRRRTFPGWPYNLYAMMHARSMPEIQHTIDKFLADTPIEDYQLLPTARELKKSPVQQNFNNPQNH